MLKISIETVTPEIASSWLKAAQGKNFRSLNANRIRVLADEISALGWVDDGSPFRFDQNGILIDGQHRATVIVKLGLTVNCAIVRGVHDGSTIDTNWIRNTRQFLKADGEPNHSIVASSTRLLMTVLDQKNVMSTPTGNNARRTSRQVKEALNNHPGMRDSVEFTKGCVNVLPATIAAVVHYILGVNGLTDEANLFFAKLISGAGLEFDDPIYQLREKLIRLKSSTAAGFHTTRMRLVVTAWNRYITKRQMPRAINLESDVFLIGYGGVRLAFPLLDGGMPVDEIDEILVASLRKRAHGASA